MKQRENKPEPLLAPAKQFISPVPSQNKLTLHTIKEIDEGNSIKEAGTPIGEIIPGIRL